MISASRFYFEKMTVKSVTAFMYAMEEARALNLRAIGSEFILLGLVKDNDNLASSVLNTCGVDYFPLKKEVEKFHPLSPVVWQGEIKLGFTSKNLLIQADKESKNAGLDYVNTKHLLLAIIEEKEGLANKILLSFDVDPLRLKALLAEKDGEDNPLKDLEPDPFPELEALSRFRQDQSEEDFVNYPSKPERQNPGNIFSSFAFAVLYLYLLVYLYFVLVGI